MSCYEGYYDDKPVADYLEYRYFAEETTMVTAMITGEIDIAADLSVTSVSTLEVRSDIQLFSEKCSAADLLRFNSKTGPAADKKLRQAQSLSIKEFESVVHVAEGETLLHW